MSRGGGAAGMWVAGVLSGTSADGVSACLARFTGRAGGLRVGVLYHREDPFPPALRARIHRAAAGALEGAALLRELVALDALLGERFARSVERLARAAGRRPDLVGLHGQTIAHVPARRAGARGEAGTLQIGSPSVVAERTGAPVVSDFRRRDMAAGGEGAPLVPILDHALYARAGVPRVILNLGGIANVTILPGLGGAERVRAWDVGPANMLIDRAVLEATRGRAGFDRGGRRALAGSVSDPLLGRMLAHPFLALAPPKSADRADFEGRWWESVRGAARRARTGPADFLATLAAFTAEAVARDLRRGLAAPPRDLFVAGGGARNAAIMRELATRIPGARVAPLPGGDSREALLFAYLAWLHSKGRPGNLPAVTGARRAVVLGSLTPGLGRGVPEADTRKMREVLE